MRWREVATRPCSARVSEYSERAAPLYTLQHLRELPGTLRFGAPAGATARGDRVGLWFHDAIYDVHRKDNEERRAVWARDSMLEAGLSLESARVHALVMATKHAGPADEDTKLLVDADLAIWARRWSASTSPTRRSARNMRTCAEDFKSGRCGVLWSFLTAASLCHPVVRGTGSRRRRARTCGARSTTGLPPTNDDQPVQRKLERVISAVDQPQQRRAIGELVVDAEAGGDEARADQGTLHQSTDGVSGGGMRPVQQAAISACRKLIPNTIAGCPCPSLRRRTPSFCHSLRTARCEYHAPPAQYAETAAASTAR